MDLNKVQIIGRLTRDPEARTTTTGKNVTSFSVATGFAWTDQAGQKKENTEFHNVVAWQKLGEIVAQYLRKGSQVYIEGRLQTRSWEGQDGVKRYKTEIIADNMIMLGGKPSGASTGSQNQAPRQETASPQEASAASPQPKPASEEEISVEDIPF